MASLHRVLLATSYVLLILPVPDVEAPVSSLALLFFQNGCSHRPFVHDFVRGHWQPIRGRRVGGNRVVHLVRGLDRDHPEIDAVLGFDRHVGQFILVPDAHLPVNVAQLWGHLKLPTRFLGPFIEAVVNFPSAVAVGQHSHFKTAVEPVQLQVCRHDKGRFAVGAQCLRVKPFEARRALPIQQGK